MLATRVSTAVCLAAAVLIGAVAAPAQAATAVGGVFTGTMTFGAGLNPPISPSCATGLTLCPGGTVPWALTGTGVGVGASSDPATGAPVLDIAGTGTAFDGVLPNLVGPDGAWCGWSRGTGAVSVSVGGVHQHVSVHWVQSVANVYVLTSVGVAGDLPVVTPSTTGDVVVGIVAGVFPGATTCPVGGFPVVGAVAVVDL